ncbi:MAG TPA: GMC family oxidoreductase [Candidatus Limnocylindria bacterium]|nr:GMC family oxidoreductase [Candidatus Limnocylindria bacterium]
MPRSAERFVDVLVIGSGPGGAITACLLAEAGRQVLLVEEGPWLPLGATEPFSPEEMRRKYRSGGVTVALGSPKIAYAEGRCVGGGSEINSGLYHRTPDEVLDAWSRDFGLRGASPEELAPHFDACERELGVGLLPGPASPASRRLEAGASRLGWKAIEVPRWYRYADGVATKQSMSETYVPRAVAAGCAVVANTRVVRLRRVAGTWCAEAVRRDDAHRPETVELRARTVFVAGGAVQTPALLRRSGIRRGIGDALHFHPTVKVVAEFPDVVNDVHAGVPVHQIKEFAPRLSLGGSASAPPHLALAMTDHPEHLRPVLAEWRRHAIYYAAGTGGRGRVRAVPLYEDPLVRYALADSDLRELALGLRRLCECLLAAGAVRLYPSVRGVPPLAGEVDLGRLPSTLPRERTSAMTVHAFSTCPMGEAPGCATDSHGRVHGVPDLYVADASLLCGPPGVNPQGSVMAFARRNALAFLEAV